jgi:hypothetical protein
MELLNDARDLVDICRATQTDFLNQSLKHDFQAAKSLGGSVPTDPMVALSR